MPTFDIRVTQLEREVEAQKELWTMVGALQRRVTQLEREVERLKRPSERPTVRPGSYSLSSPRSKKE